MIHNVDLYHKIISLGNLYAAWGEFASDKKRKSDVSEFALNLSSNIFALHNSLVSKTYRHGGYKAFSINDPKPRRIHKATVRDRLLHHAIYRILYPHFDRKFIFDSYSCRIEKGTHRAMDRFKYLAMSASLGNMKTVHILKCDIKKCFASIDHQVLISILDKFLPDDVDARWLLQRVISSFETMPGKGLPLGNLTSQLLVNIYMNELDQWVKHKMKEKYYIRYADDFVILSRDKDYLLELTPKIADFLEERLELSLHPDKVFVKTFASGVDFLGWIHFPNHRVLRSSTKRRIFRNLERNNFKEESVASYIGMLRHGNTAKLKEKIENLSRLSFMQ